MITDQKQTGVPNRDAFSTQGINKRTQLIKPVQVNNTGLTANQAGSTPRFNPVKPAYSSTTANSSSGPVAYTNSVSAMPNRPEQEPAAQMTPVEAPASVASPSNDVAVEPGYAMSNAPEQDVTGSIPQTADANSFFGETPEVAPTPVSQIENARAAIRGMSNKEIVTLLNEIASGNLRGME